MNSFLKINKNSVFTKIQTKFAKLLQFFSKRLIKLLLFCFLFSFTFHQTQLKTLRIYGLTHTLAPCKYLRFCLFMHTHTHTLILLFLFYILLFLYPLFCTNIYYLFVIALLFSKRLPIEANGK